MPLLLAALLVLVVQSAWAERWVEATASKALSRQVEIERIRVQFAWPPTLHFDHLRVSNPEWAKTPNLIDAKDLLASFEVGPLFEKRIVIPFLHAGSATAGVEKSGERETWQFTDQRKQGEQKPSRIELQRVYLNDGRIFYRVDDEGTELDVRVKGSAGEGGNIEAQASGKFRGEPAQATASVPSLSTQPSGPVRFTGKATLGHTQASAEGELSSSLERFDMEVKVAGKTLSDLHKAIGVVLPDTPPYTIAGHLHHEGNEYVFDPFQGKVGESDLRGALAFLKHGTRPFLRGNVQSNLLDFKDLGPVVGAPPKKSELAAATPEQKQAAAKKEATGKVLPDRKFDTSKWAKMDADVRLDAKRVLRPKQLPIDKLSTHILLREGVLHLQPLDFGMAGGRLSTDIVLDSTKKPLLADAKVDVQGLQLSQLFPALNSMSESFGAMQGHARLVGHGESIAEMLGTSDGEIDVAVEKGQVSLLLVKLLDLDVPHVLMLLGTPHKQVELRCAVASVPVKQGVATPESFIVDTSDTIVYVKGDLSLQEEQLDLVTYPRPKGKSVFVARVPIEMKGAFQKPKVRPKAGPLAARVGAAVALGAATGGVGAIVPLLETGPGKDADCAKLVGEVRAKGRQQRDAAPGTVQAQAQSKPATNKSKEEKKAAPEKSEPEGEKEKKGIK